MSATILTSTIIGLDGYPVETECDISPGLPAFSVVGLPDAAVQEARERVRSAMRHSDLAFPRTRITVNLAPADLRKAGTCFDLPMAIAILTAHGDVPASDPRVRLLIGELALDGRLRAVPGILSTALLAEQLKCQELILPQENAHEAALVTGLPVYGASTLRQVVDHLTNTKPLSLTEHRAIPTESKTFFSHDLASIRGQEQAKRALEVAAAGGHNILLQGPPGSGKTLLARTFPSILPSLNHAEAVDVTRIHSVAGLLARDGVVGERPFRAPHHTASGVALVGGGSMPKPGEISLAHRGVLFLDELPEFSRHVLENLRQPLEDGFVSVSRAHGTVAFPARFMLVAAMNPCPCGYATDPDHPCSCTHIQLLQYRKRLSGPLLDRIDLMIEVPKVPTEKLVDLEPGESSLIVRERVCVARQRQLKRFCDLHILTNAELTSEQARCLVVPSPAAQQILRQAVDRYRLSARAYFRVLKVARTIADLAVSDDVDVQHVTEALHYRQALEV